MKAADSPTFGRFVDEGQISYLRGLLFTFGEFEVVDELMGLLVAAGRLDEAVIAGCHVAGGGDPDALARLGELLAAPDLVAQAITQLEQRADDPEEYEDAAPALAELLYRRGLLDRLLAKAAEGDCFASMRAAGILVEQGRSDKAIRILRAQADRGGLWDENARKKAAEIEQQEIRRTS